MSVVEVLQEARKRIQGGWIKGSLMRKNPRVKQGISYCLVGGVGLLGHPDKTLDARIALRRALGTGQSLMTFNDRSTTTKKDVLNLIDWAIALAEQGEA